MEFNRITIESGKMGGKPCIRGMRISVDIILDLMAGETFEEILLHYPYLEREDLQEALYFAAETVRQGHWPDNG